MNNIAHRDLKPENIMFVVQDDGTKNLKVSMFCEKHVCHFK